MLTVKDRLKMARIRQEALIDGMRKIFPQEYDERQDDTGWREQLDYPLQARYWELKYHIQVITEQVASLVILDKRLSCLASESRASREWEIDQEIKVLVAKRAVQELNNTDKEKFNALCDERTRLMQPVRRSERFRYK
jgi:hypothetical protein